MPILQHCPHPDPTKLVKWIRNLPNHEAGRILHYGTCPLTGQIQQGGSKGPFCSDRCVGPTPPVAIEVSCLRRVLRIDGNKALVWDYRTKKAKFIPLPENPIFPPMVIVDADDMAKTRYERWRFGRELAVNLRKEKEALAAAELARITSAELAEKYKALADAFSLGSVSPQQKLAEAQTARICKGKQVVFVSDTPHKKVKLRKKSRVSLIGTCVSNPDYDGFLFVNVGGTTSRAHKSQIRVILNDGSVAVEDTFQ